MKVSKEQLKNLKQHQLELEQEFRKYKEQSEISGSKKDFDGELWNLSKDIFITKTKLNGSFQQYSGLIFTIGFSPEPIILTIESQDPEAVFFIYTKESEEVLNRIITETRLAPHQYKREIMKKSSFEYSVDLIGVGVAYLNKEKDIKIGQIGLDITGGTKIMSMACGLASFSLGPDGPDILYVDHEKYDTSLRRPVPGTEYLVIIKNPLRPVNQSFKDKGLDVHHTVI
jgi:hypothetical protein